MKQNISNSIRSAITRHLITHVKLPKGEGRCRLDILVDEASDEIIKLLSSSDSTKQATRTQHNQDSLVPDDNDWEKIKTEFNEKFTYLNGHKVLESITPTHIINWFRLRIGGRK